MNETSASITTPSTLPTLGDKPSAGLPAAPKKRRFGRKLMFAGIAGLALATSATTAYAVTGGSFTDTGGHAFESDIEWANSHDVAYGYSDGSFKPNAPVTRGAMTAFIHRYNQQTEKVTQNFVFTNAGSYANSATCPAGKTPVGGGGQTNSPGFAITDSYITTGSTWNIRWETKNADLKSGTGFVFVICQPVG